MKLKIGKIIQYLGIGIFAVFLFGFGVREDLKPIFLIASAPIYFLGLALCPKKKAEGNNNTDKKETTRLPRRERIKRFILIVITYLVTTFGWFYFKLTTGHLRPEAASLTLLFLLILGVVFISYGYFKLVREKG